MWLARDPDLRAIWRQHPNRNLQSPADGVDDGDRAIFPLGSAQDFESSGLEWMERIKDLDVRALRTQGIVGGGVFILTCTAWFPAVVWRRTTNTGSSAAAASSCPYLHQCQELARSLAEPLPPRLCPNCGAAALVVIQFLAPVRMDSS